MTVSECGLYVTIHFLVSFDCGAGVFGALRVPSIPLGVL